MKGVNVLFDTRAPTDEEKESLPEIVLTGPQWRLEEIRMVGRINVDRRRRVEEVQRIRTSKVTEEDMFQGRNVMNHGPQDPALDSF